MQNGNYNEKKWIDVSAHVNVFTAQLLKLLEWVLELKEARVEQKQTSLLDELIHHMHVNPYGETRRQFTEETFYLSNLRRTS